MRYITLLLVVIGAKKIYDDDTDRIIFLETLAKVVADYNWLCHSYCLMDNHYHLIIETLDGNLSKGMRQLNGVYTQGSLGSGPGAASEACHFLQGESPCLDKPKEWFCKV